MKQLFVMALEPDGKPVECKVLKILFESNEINIESPDGNCEWYKLSDFELIKKQLTIEELREQFEDNEKRKAEIIGYSVNLTRIHDVYSDNTIHHKFNVWVECARANNVIKDLK